VLFLRGLSALLAGWVVGLLWPQRKREAVSVALLFAVVPVFTQQPIAVTYSQHWTCSLLYLSSLGWMILAFRDARRFWLYTILSVAAMALNLFTMEYYAGVELVRPLILWLLIAENEKQPLVKSALCALGRWSPYLLVMAAFLVWRVFFLHLPADDPNALRLVAQFKDEPYTALWTLWKYFREDSIYILFEAWKPVVANVRALVTASTAALATAVYLLSLRVEPGDESTLRSWAMRASALGLLGALVSPSPAWLTGKQVTVGLYSSRFVFPGLFFISLFVVGLLALVFSNRTLRVGAFGVFIALAILFQHDNATRYVNSWEQQKRFYWQMHWRAPGVESNTPFLSDGEVLNLVGFYSTTAGLNLLYDQGSDPAGLDYWFFNMESKFPSLKKVLVQKRPFTPSFRSWGFTGFVQDALVIDNTSGGCMHLVEAARPENGLLPAPLALMASASDLSRIQADGKAVPPADVFGAEPAHTWCYFFQRASLDRQLKNWDEIARLGDQARHDGFAPTDVSEWFPFIEGYARAGQTERAAKLTAFVHSAAADYDPALCALWASFPYAEEQAREIQFLACPSK
jgi:hypothetical protein